MSLPNVLIASLLAGGANALLPLVAKGNKFYQLNEDYNQPATAFTLFGVDYQPGGASDFNLGKSSDLLTDPATCQRDAYLLKQLGANAIRIYSVSPWLNHDECMSIFNDAGIYVLLDVNTPDSSLHRSNIESSYNEGYLNNIFGLVDAFKNYPNLLGFIAGNEIINDGPSAKADPTYIRAVIRDLKQYINKWSNRTIPVGYAAADVLEYRTETWQYFQCDANTGNASVDVWSRADFFGINSYEWCSGVNDYTSSGYDKVLSTFNDSSIPIIFTEYGCNTKRPRSFEEVDQGIYGPLKDVVSGGFVYEYSNEVSNYGLVEIDSSGNVSLLKDYDNLKSAFSKVTTEKATATITASPTGTEALKGVPTCTSADKSGDFDWNFDLPSCPASNLIESNGGNRNIGSIISLTSTPSNSFSIKDSNGSQINPTFSYDDSYKINSQSNAPSSSNGGSSSSMPTSSSSSAKKTSASNASHSASSSSTTTDKKSKNSAFTNKLNIPLALSCVSAVLVSALL